MPDHGNAALFADPPAPPPTEPSTSGDDPHPSFISVTGTLFRCADYDTPVWSRPNDLSGRWHRADGRSSVQYWSYSPSTAWAEKLRFHGITEEADLLEMTSRMWVGQIDATAIADLTDPAWLRWLRSSPEVLIEDSHGRCQDLGEQLRQCGASGLVAPSAAIPERLNLVLYQRLVRGDWHESPTGVPHRLRFPETVLPVRLVAVGHPDPTVIHDVRHRARAPEQVRLDT